MNQTSASSATPQQQDRQSSTQVLPTVSTDGRLTSTVTNPFSPPAQISVASRAEALVAAQDDIAKAMARGAKVGSSYADVVEGTAASAIPITKAETPVHPVPGHILAAEVSFAAAVKNGTSTGLSINIASAAALEAYNKTTHSRNTTTPASLARALAEETGGCYHKETAGTAAVNSAASAAPLTRARVAKETGDAHHSCDKGRDT